MAGLRIRSLGRTFTRLLPTRTLPKLPVAHLQTEFRYFTGAMKSLKNGDVRIPFLQRIPLSVIILGNMNISFLSARVIMTALRDYLPNDVVDALPAIFQKPDPQLIANDTPFNTAWANINLLWLGATTFFTGVDGFFPRESEFRKTTLAAGVRRLFEKAEFLHHIHPSLPDYMAEGVLRGSIGATEMVGVRNPEIIGPLVTFKTTLRSRPFERIVPESAKTLAKIPDDVLDFFGRLTPHKRGALIGFGIDITANTILEVAGALVFTKSADLYKLIIPGFFISAFIAYANTRISQSQGVFNSSQKLLHRAHLGILKTAFYRGPYGSGVTTSWFNFLIQVGYGLWAIRHADRITQPKPLELYPPEVLARLEAAKRNDKLTVATLDSGLGGLLVFAETHTHLQRGAYRDATSIFLNAQTGPELGFNSQATMADKARQLDHVLNETMAQLHPDLIILACHTMSLIYPHTEFAKKRGPEIPAVVDIMTASVELMVHAVSEAPESQLVVMSTPAVSASGAYQKRLVERNVREDRVMLEPSPDLATSIQNDPSGETTIALVNAHASHVRTTLQNLGRLTDPVLVALNCSQYVLIAGIIQDAFVKQGLDARVINPAHEIIAGLFKTSPTESQAVSAKAVVYSEVPIHQQLGTYIDRISSVAADAVKAWRPADGMAIPQPTSQ